jgi:hypothetical protein
MRAPAHWLRLAVLLAAVGASAVAPAHAGEVELIVSPDRSGIPLDRTLVRALYTMRLRAWPDGTTAEVFVLPDHYPLHDLFTREELATYPYVLRNVWDRLVFTGTGFAPTVVNSEDEMRARVRATPGAIGYVRAQGSAAASTPGGAP